MNTLVSVKTVTLAEDAYESLAAKKKEGESFSDVVRRLTLSTRSLKEFVGGWADVSPEQMAEFGSWLDNSDRSSRAELTRLGRKRSR